MPQDQEAKPMHQARNKETILGWKQSTDVLAREHREVLEKGAEESKSREMA